MNSTMTKRNDNRNFDGLGGAGRVTEEYRRTRPAASFPAIFHVAAWMLVMTLGGLWLYVAVEQFAADKRRQDIRQMDREDNDPAFRKKQDDAILKNR